MATFQPAAPPPTMATCASPNQARSKTVADLIRSSSPQGPIQPAWTSLGPKFTPVKKGNTFSVVLDNEFVASCIGKCSRFAFISGLMQPRGSTPWKFHDLRDALKSLWNLDNWHMLSIGTGASPHPIAPRPVSPLAPPRPRPHHAPPLEVPPPWVPRRRSPAARGPRGRPPRSGPPSRSSPSDRPSALPCRCRWTSMRAAGGVRVMVRLLPGRPRDELQRPRSTLPCRNLPH